MKKELFEKWYENYGRNLAIEICPYDYYEKEDDVWNKELRRKAKKIFSNIYDVIYKDYSAKLDDVQYEIKNALEKTEIMLIRSKKLNDSVKQEIKGVKEITTKLYDSYLNKNDDEYSKDCKKFYGEKLDKLKTESHCIENTIKNLKITKKDIESLITYSL